jgi:hypothetical protein
MTPLTRFHLEAVAEIIGPNSASQKALDEADAFLALYKMDGRYRHVNFYKDGADIVIEKIDLGPEGMGS